MPKHSLGVIKTGERDTYLNTSHPTIVTTRNNHTNLSGVTSMETKVNSSRQFLAHLRPVLLKIFFCNCDDRPRNPLPRNKIPHCLSIPCFAPSKRLPHFSSSLIHANGKGSGNDGHGGDRPTNPRPRKSPHCLYPLFRIITSSTFLHHFNSFLLILIPTNGNAVAMMAMAAIVNQTLADNRFLTVSLSP